MTVLSGSLLICLDLSQSSRGGGEFVAASEKNKINHKVKEKGGNGCLDCNLQLVIRDINSCIQQSILHVILVSQITF